MVKMVNFLLRVFYYNNNTWKEESVRNTDWCQVWDRDRERQVLGPGHRWGCCGWHQPVPLRDWRALVTADTPQLPALSCQPCVGIALGRRKPSYPVSRPLPQGSSHPMRGQGRGRKGPVLLAPVGDSSEEWAQLQGSLSGQLESRCDYVTTSLSVPSCFLHLPHRCHAESLL